LYQTARKIALGNTWVTDGKEIAGYPQYSAKISPAQLTKIFAVFSSQLHLAEPI
jgi:hypothetical protein